MIRDLLAATDEVLDVWDVVNAETLVGDVVNRIYQRYGKAGLCGLTSQLIRSSIPPAMAKELNSREPKMVVPQLVDDAEDDDGACGECEDCKNYACMNSVMQYMAAVIANDPDMTIAIFKANVVSVKDERSQRWLSLVISTACNTRFAVEDA